MALGSLIGGGLGALVGGPAGALVGSQIGGGIDGSRAQRKAGEASAQARGNALNYLNHNYLYALQGLNSATGEARDDVRGAFGGYQQDLQGGLGQFNQFAQPYAAVGQPSLSRLQAIANQGLQTSPTQGLAQDRLSQLMQGNVTASPGYQFRLNAGLDAVQNRIGGRNSPVGSTALKSINDYAQQSASDEYARGLQQAMAVRNAEQDIAGQNYARQFDSFGALTNIGQNAAFNQGEAALNTASRIGQGRLGTEGDVLRLRLQRMNMLANLRNSLGANAANMITGAGDARANSIVGASDALNNGIQAGLGNLSYMDLLNRGVIR